MKMQSLKCELHTFQVIIYLFLKICFNHLYIFFLFLIPGVSFKIFSCTCLKASQFYQIYDYSHYLTNSNMSCHTHK